MDKISRLRNFKMFKQVHKDKISRLRNVQMFKQVHKDKFLGYVSFKWSNKFIRIKQVQKDQTR